jgi:Protein of unknown function (DUF642)
MKFVLSAIVSTALPLLAMPASANLLANGSFESAARSPNSVIDVGSTDLTDWSVVGSGNLLWCDSSAFCARPAFDGSYSLDLTGLTNRAPYAGVTQSVATLVGETYELTFALAGRSDATPVSASATAGSVSAVFSNTTDSWETKKLSFVASESLTPITLLGLSAGGSGLILQIDDASLIATPIPEPSTWALLLCGGLFTLRLADSRRKAQDYPSCGLTPR